MWEVLDIVVSLVTGGFLVGVTMHYWDQIKAQRAAAQKKAASKAKRSKSAKEAAAARKLNGAAQPSAGDQA